MKNTIAYCGFDCEKCKVYLATVNNKQALHRNDAKLWAESNDLSVLLDQMICEGCRSDGRKIEFCEKQCEIRKCASKKNVRTCKDCFEFDECKTIKEILSNNPDAFKNLGI
ncbi:MAG: DUF3795 domain-containing protein [Eubacteriales bacterium]|nr:DUF3795 domain-containing protein [Eubacteriales bacterium]